MRTPPGADLSADLLQALGTLVVRHAALEEALRDALWVAAKTDKVIVHVLLSGLNFGALVDKFGAVYYEHHPAHRDDIRALCAHLVTLNEQRNTLIHSFWTTQGEGEHMLRLKLSAKPKTGLVVRAEDVPPSRVHELATELGHAEEKVWEVISDLSLPSVTPEGAG